MMASTSNEDRCSRDVDVAVQTDVDVDIRQLMDAAIDVRERAYCPYSNFRVGTAVLTADGTIFTGVNVENASYGMTVCAERVAIFNAVSNGHCRFRAYAVCCDVKGEFKSPCGACRQVIAEFADENSTGDRELAIYAVRPDRTWRRIPFAGLLPDAFTPASLRLAAASREDAIAASRTDQTVATSEAMV